MGGVLQGKVGSYTPANVRQPIAGLRVAQPGEFELRILKERRDYPEPPPWEGYHEKCWTQGLPAYFPPPPNVAARPTPAPGLG